MNTRRKWILIVSTLVILLSLSMFIYTYYSFRKPVPIILETGDVNSSIMISFNGVDVGDYYDAETKLIDVDATNPEAPNYIGKLKVEINVSSTFASRFRVRILDEWIKTRDYIDPLYEDRSEVIGHEVYPFSLQNQSDYIFNNGTFYFRQMLEANGSYAGKTIIEGGTGVARRVTVNYIETVSLKLAVYIDVIQANRYPELWGLPVNYYD